MKRCEHCLRETTGACPAHPHAELLDPQKPSDQEWIAVLEQRRTQRRWRLVYASLSVAVALLSVFWTPLLLTIIPLGTLAAIRRPHQLALHQPYALLPPDDTPREPRLQRRVRGSGRRPAPGRVTIAG